MPPRRPSKSARSAASGGDLRSEIGKKKPFDRPEVEAFLNLFRTCSIFTTQTTRFFRDFGLTEAQYNALRILRGHASHPDSPRPDVGGTGGVPSQTIGQQLVAQVPDVTRLVDRLVDAGFAERLSARTDRRIVLVRITKAGLDLLAQIDAPLIELHRQQLGHMSRADLAELNRLLVLARRGDDKADPVTARCPDDHPINT